MNFCVNTCNSLKSSHFCYLALMVAPNRQLTKSKRSTDIIEQSLSLIKISLRPNSSPFARGSAEVVGAIHTCHSEPDSPAVLLFLFATLNHFLFLGGLQKWHQHIAQPWIGFDPSSSPVNALGQ